MSKDILQPHIAFSDEPCFYKFSMHIFLLDLDTSSCTALCDVINFIENLNNSFVKISQNKNKDVFFIHFPEEHTFSESFEV